MTRALASAVLAGCMVAIVVTGCAHRENAAAPDSGDVANGKRLFAANCSSCHGANGIEGGIGPSLRGESARKNLNATIVWIHHPQPPMPQLYPAPLSAGDVVDIASYVQTL